MELLTFGKTGWGDELFYATLMTVAVAVTAMFIGFLFSLIFTPLKLSNNKDLNLIANSYTTVIRGVPELLVIYLFFFGGSGAIMYVYYIILISHILLAGLSLPFILFTAYRASISEFSAHKKMAKYVFPVWLYVAVTGVVVYLMISPYY